MRILLMRHGNVDKTLKPFDFDHELTARGKREVEEASEFLLNYNIDKAISSPSRRTMETFEIINEKNNIASFSKELTIYNSLHIEDFLYLINQENDESNTILLIGHNPMMALLSCKLALDDYEYQEKLQNLTGATARVVVLNFPDVNKWKDIRLNSAHLENIFTPIGN